MAFGGGIGYRRLVELVAYCREFAPYYRFLHEDTMGSTAATTGLSGDRLDEYDYTDYGIPLHAPVVLDGRHITGIAPHGSYADVSEITLDADVAGPDTLVGREIRVVKAGSSAGDVYLAATVISHLGTVVHIADPGNAIASAWGGCDQPLAAVYDLHEGWLRGVVDSVSTGAWGPDGGWGQWIGQTFVGEPCTYLRVDNGPFLVWMRTVKAQQFSNVKGGRKVQQVAGRQKAGRKV